MLDPSPEEGFQSSPVGPLFGLRTGYLSFWRKNSVEVAGMGMRL